MSVRTVALTGGTGFIGRALALRHLKDGDSVRILSRQPGGDLARLGCHVTVGDLTDVGPGIVAFVDGADVLYHCAGNLSDREQMHAVNVAGTRRLLRVAAGRVGRWVQLSSAGVYERKAVGEVTEGTPLAPANEYERTKLKGDELVMGGSTPYTIVRPTIVFGPAMPNNSLRSLVRTVERGRFVFIGRPGSIANYVYVDDVAEALHLCGLHASAVGKAFIVSEHRTMEQFIGTIADAVGRPTPRLRMPKLPMRIVASAAGRVPGSPLTPSRVEALTSRLVYRSERISDELGFAATAKLEDVLRAFARSTVGLDE